MSQTGDLLSYALYRTFITLRDGKWVLMRLLNPQDGEALSALLAAAPAEDLRFLKAMVTEPGLVPAWLEQLNYRRLLPLAAVDLEAHQFMGLATLKRIRRAEARVGDLEVFVASPWRHQGLGSLLLEELIALAVQENLAWLRAEVPADHRPALRAFQARGFTVKALFENYLRTPDGATRDMVLLMRPVLPPRPMKRKLKPETEDRAF